MHSDTHKVRVMGDITIVHMSHSWHLLSSFSSPLLQSYMFIFSLRIIAETKNKMTLPHSLLNQKIRQFQRGITTQDILLICFFFCERYHKHIVVSKSWHLFVKLYSYISSNGIKEHVFVIAVTKKNALTMLRCRILNQQRVTYYLMSDQYTQWRVHLHTFIEVDIYLLLFIRHFFQKNVTIRS